MWRIAALVGKRSDVGDDFFASGWLEYLPSAIVHDAEGVSQLARLIVNVPPEKGQSEALEAVFPQDYDGLMEFWFDDAQAAVAAWKMLGTNPALTATAADLIDNGRSLVWLAKALPVKPESGTRIKFTAAGLPAEGVTSEQAQDYWVQKHPLVVRSAPKVWKPLTRYTQFHGVAEPGLESDWLGSLRALPLCSDMGFSSIDDLLAAYINEEYAEIVRPDELNFCRPSEAFCFLGVEERVVFERS